MSLFNVVIYATMLLGIILVVYSLLSMKRFAKEDEAPEKRSEDTAVDMETLVEADKAIHELSDLSESVMKDVDDKYKEMLFLYSLIDEKKQEIAKTYHTPPTVKKEPQQVVKTPVSEDTKEVIKPVNEGKTNIHTRRNPKHDKIQALYQQGKDISEIAKSLQIGKGEVQLIIEMGRNR